MDRAKLRRLFESQTTLTLFAFNDTAYNNLPYQERNIIDSYSETDLADYIKFCTSKWSLLYCLVYLFVYDDICEIIYMEILKH